MKRRGMTWAGAALAVLLVAPPGARADVLVDTNVCTAGSLTLCNSFSLTKDGDSYTLVVMNNTSPSNVTDYGELTGVGIFNTTSTDFGFDNLSGVPTGFTGYTGSVGTICNDLGGGSYSQTDLNVGACKNGVPGVQAFTLSFTTTTDLTGHFANGDLVIGTHVQSIGTCSAKFRSDGSAVLTTPGDGTLSGCEPTSTVPEPVTVALFGTGLLGLGLIRRRKGGDVAND